MDLDELAAINGITDADNIYAGQTLKLPNSNAGSTGDATDAAP